MCGGGSGGGTQQTATSFSSESGPWSPQVPHILSGFDEARRLYKQGVPDYYPGATLAGFDPAQTAAQQATLGYAMGPRAAAQQAGAERQLLDTYGLSKNLGRMGGLAARRGLQLQGSLSEGQYSRLTPFSNSQYRDLLAGNVRTGAGTPYDAMANALTQNVTGNLQKNILPGIRQQQVMYQPGGSSRAALQQNQAVTDAVQSGLTKPLADMYSNAYQTAQGQRLPSAQMGLGAQQFGMNYGLAGQDAARQAGGLGLAAVQQYPTTMNAPMNMYNAIGEVGAQRRAMTQEAINRDMQRYAYESNAPQQALQNYMSMITGNYGGTSSGGSSSTTTNTPSGGGGLGNIIGTLGQAYIMSQSDIRVKENIVPEGTTWKGLSVYNYNYIGDERPRRGVMAQQVETMYPDAVTTIDGVKHVNYGAI